MEDKDKLTNSLSNITNSIEDINLMFQKDRKLTAKAISYIYGNLNTLSTDTYDKIRTVVSAFDKYNDNITNLRLSINNTNKHMMELNNNLSYVYSSLASQIATINVQDNNIKKSSSTWGKLLNKLTYPFGYFRHRREEKRRLEEEQKRVAEEQKQREYEETLRIEKEKQEAIRKQKEKELEEEQERQRRIEEANKQLEYDRKKAEELNKKRQQIRDILAGVRR